MNTNTAMTASISPARGRLAARVVGILAILLASIAGVFATTAPAQAAGTYATGVYFCTTPNVNVSLEKYYSNGSTSAYKTGNSGSTGCATFRYVDPGYQYIVTRTVVRGTCTTGATMSVYASYYGTARANVTLNLGSLSLWYSQRIC